MLSYDEKYDGYQVAKKAGAEDADMSYDKKYNGYQVAKKAGAEDAYSR